MEAKLKDFIVDTKGHCFLCLSKILIGDNSFTSSSVYSFQYISQYLKISRRHVFDEKLPVPLTLLEKVEKSLLKVSLCESCGALADKLEDQIKLLERIRMEVNDGVNKVRDKLDGALRSGAEDQFKSLANGSSIEMEKVNIVQRLRTETSKKCSLKLERTQPRVRLKDVVRERRKRKVETIIIGGEDDHNPTRLSVELNQQPKIPRKSLQSLSSDYKSVFLNHKSDESELRSNYANNSCLLCKTVFTGFTNFKRHFEGVHLRLRFTCDICNDSFSQRHGLRLHLRVVHPQRYQEYMAEKEEENKKNQVEKRSSLETISVPLNYVTSDVELLPNYNNDKRTCRLCSKFIANYSAFKRHFESSHLNLRFTCDVCNAEYSQRGELKVHLRDIHPERYHEYEVEIAKKGKQNGSWNKVPLTYQTSESEFRENYLNNACRLCNLANVDFTKFKRHYESIHLKLKFTCDICSAAYSDRPKMRTHLRLRHPEHYQEYARKQIKKEVVDRHIAIMDRTCVPLNFATDEGELRANFSGNTCLACNKGCQHYSSFKEHFEAVHLKLRFTCDICNVGYSTRNKLKNHLRRHHPDHYRQHYEKEFGDRDKGQRGATIKTPVPLNYQPSESEVLSNYVNNLCLLCNKEFSSTSSFKRHFESIHLRLHFTCDVCNQGFSQRYGLRVHLLTSHPERYQEYQTERAEVEVKTELVEMPVSTEDGTEESIVVATPQEVFVPRVMQKRRMVGNSRKCRKCNKYFASSLALWRHEGSVHLKICSRYGRFPKLNGSDDEEDKEEKKRLRDEERQKRREGRDHFYYVAKEAKPEVDLPFPCDKCSMKFRSRRGLKLHNDIVHLKAYAIGWQSRGWRKKKDVIKQIGVKGESSENQDVILEAAQSEGGSADVNVEQHIMDD